MVSPWSWKVRTEEMNVGRENAQHWEARSYDKTKPRLNKSLNHR